MSTPEFIVALREKIGHAPLWLTGVTAVVVRRSQILLVRRADSGKWAPVTGIIDPGEEPADACAREVLEEAGVVAIPEHLALVHVTPPVVHQNGDQAQYLDLVFRLQWVGGDPYPADGENLAAQWFDMDDLPDMPQNLLDRIEIALDFSETTAFKFSDLIRN